MAIIEGTNRPILATDIDPKWVYENMCPKCPLFGKECEGMVNFPQGVNTAKLKPGTTFEEAEKLVETKAMC